MASLHIHNHENKMEEQLITHNDMVQANSYFVDEYFKDLIFNIRRYNRKRKTREKDILSNCDPPTICCCNHEDIEILTEFANEIKSQIGIIPNGDICIAILMAYYSISQLEHDEFVDYDVIIKKATHPSVTAKLYLGICGVNVTTKSMNLFDKNIIRLDYNKGIFKKIRAYMVLGKHDKCKFDKFYSQKQPNKDPQPNKEQNCEKTCCVHQ